MWPANFAGFFLEIPPRTRPNFTQINQTLST